MKMTATKIQLGETLMLHGILQIHRSNSVSIVYGFKLPLIKIIFSSPLEV